MAAVEAKIAQLAGKPLVWTLLIGVLFGLPLLRGLRAGQPPAAPPVLGRFPAFMLRDDQGGAFSDGDLRGRAFIANLICARCGAAGAAAAERMRSLQYRTRN